MFWTSLNKLPTFTIFHIVIPAFLQDLKTVRMLWTWRVFGRKCLPMNAWISSFGKCTSVYRVPYTSGGAGFQPSTIGGGFNYFNLNPNLWGDDKIWLADIFQMDGSTTNWKVVARAEVQKRWTAAFFHLVSCHNHQLIKHMFHPLRMRRNPLDHPYEPADIVALDFCSFRWNSNEMLRWGPYLPVTHGVITPISRVITPITHL